MSINQAGITDVLPSHVPPELYPPTGAGAGT